MTPRKVAQTAPRLISLAVSFSPALHILTRLWIPQSDIPACKFRQQQNHEYDTKISNGKNIRQKLGKVLLEFI